MADKLVAEIVVNSIDDIVNDRKTVHEALGSVVKVIKKFDEDNARVPSKAVFLLEGSGEEIVIGAWGTDLNSKIENYEGKGTLLNVMFTSSEFNGQPSPAVKEIAATRKKSKVEPAEKKAPVKAVKSGGSSSSSSSTYSTPAKKAWTPTKKPQAVTLTIDGLKQDVADLLSNVSNPRLVELANKVITPEFYTCAAACGFHHDYTHGLAFHSVSVARNALSIAVNYKSVFGYNINIDNVIIGALLHDCGKILEYHNNEPKMSHLGHYVGHIVLGSNLVLNAAKALNFEQDDQDITEILHIISSHHGKLEQGSPSVPATIEAYIVSEADMMDSRIEPLIRSLKVTGYLELSDKQFLLDNRKYINTAKADGNEVEDIKVSEPVEVKPVKKEVKVVKESIPTPPTPEDFDDEDEDDETPATFDPDFAPSNFNEDDKDDVDTFGNVEEFDLGLDDLDDGFDD